MIMAGPQSFVDRIKEYYGGEKMNREIPSSRAFTPDADRIRTVVWAFYGIVMPAI